MEILKKLLGGLLDGLLTEPEGADAAPQQEGVVRYNSMTQRYDMDYDLEGMFDNKGGTP